MFDFSLSELMLIMVVALIVIGPERLPKVARTLGHLWGRAQRYVNGVKADIERDMAVEEFRQLQQKVQAEASAVEKSFQEAAKTADQQVREINEAVAKLSTPNETADSGQDSKRQEQSAESPSTTPPANKPE